MKWKIAILALISGFAVQADGKQAKHKLMQLVAVRIITDMKAVPALEVSQNAPVIAWDLHKVLFTEQGKSGHDCEPREEMFALVKELSEKGVRQVILSNISKESFAILRSKYPSHFAYFDLSHSLANAQGIFTRKPHRKYFDKFLEQIHAPAQNIIFVDDKPKNIEGARKAGINAELFSSVESLRDVFKKRGIL